LRSRFQSVVSELVAADERLVLLLGDIGVFGFRQILESTPERVINMGILEQAMTSFAAGLSNEGRIPILHSIATFLVERPFEQIKVDFGYQGLSGKFISVGASFDYSSLGATHHSPGDVSALLAIPGFEIFLPGNSEELEHQLRANLQSQTLAYFRLSQAEYTDDRVDPKEERPQILRQGTRGTLVSFGTSLSSSHRSADDFDLTLVYLNSITPTAIQKLNEIIASDISENLILSQPFYEGTVLPILSLQQKPVRILDIGVPRKFIHQYGSVSEIEAHLNLDSVSVGSRIQEFVSGRVAL
jgi:transketolase